MQGSFGTLLKNSKAFLPGLSVFVSEAMPAFSTWKKMKDRQWAHAPTSVREQEEVYERSYLKRHHCQEKNMWVDKELSTEVSQKDIGKLMAYKQDMWRMMHAGAGLTVLGGYAAPLAAIWLGNNTWVPSQFNTTDVELKEWRIAQDMYRYKWAPAYLTETRWFFDHHATPMSSKFERGWEEMFEKNDVRRDPNVSRDAGEMYDRFITFRDMKRKTGRLLGRCMGVPTFPLWAKMCIGTRIKDYWELAWNEDYMVIKGKLHETMTEGELYDYAWRRYLAPYDKELSHEEVLQRVNDYHAFLGPKFVESGVAPNIFMTTAYCMGYYNDPAYLVEDIAELESNDYDHLSSWGKDAFLRRLEFENGPLRDQVEAHSQKVLGVRKAKAESEQPKLE